jgi:hypothetical protein
MYVSRDLAPILSNLHDQLSGGGGQRQIVHALTVYLDRARFDLTHGVRDRVRQPNLRQQFVDPDAGGGAHVFGQRRHLYVCRSFVTAHHAIEFLLRARGVRG